MSCQKKVSKIIQDDSEIEEDEDGEPIGDWVWAATDDPFDLIKTIAYELSKFKLDFVMNQTGSTGIHFKIVKSK